MSEVMNFINECGPFFVLTMNGDTPAGRPIGAMMEYEKDLYISTADTKAVYKQLIDNAKMQIVALKPGTREWIRVNGIATECFDLDMKQRMLDECPAVRKHYDAPDAPHFVLFRIQVVDYELN